MTHSFADVLRLVRFSHTLFALPFALASFALASQQAGYSGRTLAFVLLAMVAMRSAAMCFNRWADAGIDGRNPRTSNREIPAGVLNRSTVLIYTVVFSVLFFYAAWSLNELTFKLSPIAWIVCLGYSLCKRFTALGHFVLGLALGLSPVGAWIAVTGEFDPVSVWMGVTVLLWTAGFDVLYACMDLEFDRQEGLHSVPALLGVRGARRLAIFCHLGMLGSWWMMIHAGGFGWPLSGAGVLAGVLVVCEHTMADPGDMGRMNLVFFKLNVVISFVMLAGAGIEIFV